jgi:hypothetical protein
MPSPPRGGLSKFLARIAENRQRVLARKQAAAAGKPTAKVPDQSASTPSASLAPKLSPQVRIRPSQSVPAAAIQPPPGGSPTSVIDSPIGVEFKRYAYVKWLLHVLTASIILNGVCLTVLLIAGLLAGQRPLVQVTAKPSLRAEAESMFGKDIEVNEDDLLIYLNTVLTIMHRVDDRGSPDLPLLRGLVAPSVYAAALGEANRNAKPAERNMVIQNLVITRVVKNEMMVDKERGRLSAYVRGYLAIIIQSTNKHVILPYRAEVLLEMAPPGRLNRFPFVLIRREWKIDKAALDWDAEREHARPDGSAGSTSTLSPAP